MGTNNRKHEIDQRIVDDKKNSDLSNRLFVRLVAKGITFTDIDFKYTIFDNCYLRNCNFVKCDFTGTQLLKSNFYGSNFDGCKFDYAYFERTIIDEELLNSSAPGFENLKLIFARSLRKNFQSLGNSTAVNKAISLELEASEIHLKKSWHSKESYYRNKYKGYYRAEMFMKWVGFKILDIVWGNGENLFKLIRSIIISILLLSITDFLIFNDQHTLSAFGESLKNSPSIFLGIKNPNEYPDLYKSSIFLIRSIFFALFISILIKRISRR